MDTYFNFFESRHEGYILCIISKDNAHKLASDENNVDCFPCVMTANQNNQLFIPNLWEMSLKSYEINRINNFTTEICCTKFYSNSLRIGDVFYI
jgi:hypothetical protein